MTAPHGVPDAVLALIAAAVPGVTVYDGRVPEEPATRYVVFWPDIGTVRALAVCGVSDSAVFRWQTTTVALDRQAAAWLAEKVRDATVDVAPTVDGWVCGPIGHTYARGPQPDETVLERPVVTLVDLYELTADRVPVESSSS